MKSLVLMLVAGWVSSAQAQESIEWTSKDLPLEIRERVERTVVDHCQIWGQGLKEIRTKVRVDQPSGRGSDPGGVPSSASGGRLSLARFQIKSFGLVETSGVGLETKRPSSDLESIRSLRHLSECDGRPAIFLC